MRNAALVRVLQIADVLRAGRRSLDELAAQFHVCKRTVRRDLEALSLAGVPVRNTTDACANGTPCYWWVQR